MASNLISTGNCGEYFVAAELERHGFTAAVPMSNVESFDILAISHDAPYKQIAIQVKTTQKSKKEWILSEKNENLIGDNIFYIFVTLHGLSYPEYHIVPSKVVAEYISEDHKRWFSSPGRDGSQHKYTTIRKFRDEDNSYLDKWDILY